MLGLRTPELILMGLVVAVVFAARALSRAGHSVPAREITTQDLVLYTFVVFVTGIILWNFVGSHLR
jgi:hypothetical protein